MRVRFPEAATDDIVSRWMTVTAASNPALALGQLNRLSSDDARDQATAATLETWFAKDPDAARTWVQQHALPQELKDRLGGR